MAIQTCTFSLDHLGSALRESRPKRRYLRFCDFSPEEPAEGVCLMRHDVDVSLEYAARMARFEQGIGVQATYFVRMRAAGYNPLSRRGRVILTDIERGGGEVGLHYEGIADGETPDSAWRRFRQEKAMLEDLLGHRVGAALHMPKRCNDFDAGAIAQAGALYDASSQERFGGLRFVSDSNRQWRECCICDHLGGSAGLHVLLHPVWWMPEIDDACVSTIVRQLAEGD
jgi:hypothetical protein